MVLSRCSQSHCNPPVQPPRAFQCLEHLVRNALAHQHLDRVLQLVHHPPGTMQAQTLITCRPLAAISAHMQLQPCGVLAEQAQ